MSKAIRIDSTLAGGVHAGILAAQTAASMTGEDGVMPFSFDGASVRVVIIEDEPHFVGKDVAERLGYTNPTKAMNDHCRGVTKRYPIADSLGRTQHVRLLTEPDVLRLIIGSKLPAAERFERWVFEEVLPAIRRTGAYRPEPAPEVDGRVLKALGEVKALVMKQQRDIERIQSAQLGGEPDARHPDANLFAALLELREARAALWPEIERYRADGEPAGAWGERGLHEMSQRYVAADRLAKKTRARTAVGWYSKLMVCMEEGLQLGSGTHGLLISALQDAKRIGL